MRRHLMKQCAAVMTQFLWIRVPPQVWKNLGSGSLSGQTFGKRQQHEKIIPLDTLI